MLKEKYFHIRDLAWLVLLECGITRLPVDLRQIARHFGWTILTEEQYGGKIEKRIEAIEINSKYGTRIFIVYKSHLYVPPFGKPVFKNRHITRNGSYIT